MRLSAEVLSVAEQRPNPLGERELILRGLNIPAIEHLGVTRDAFDAMDLTDNRIVRVDNFPRLKRLTSLILGGNAVESVDAKNLAKNVPQLTNLVLTNNRIALLHEVANIGRGCPNLEFLSLVGNPVVKRQHYRLFAIHKLPTLKVLDFNKIKQSEREKAKRFATSAAGAALEGDVRVEAREALSSKTFVPGEGRSAEESITTNFTPEQKVQIRLMVANASSHEEIERIERAVKRGEFPASSINASSGPHQTGPHPPSSSTPPQAVTPPLPQPGSDDSPPLDHKNWKRNDLAETISSSRDDAANGDNSSEVERNRKRSAGNILEATDNDQDQATSAKRSWISTTKDS